MIPHLPLWITIFFLLTLAITLSLFYLSNNKPTKFLIALIIWAIIQSIIAYTGFYGVVDSFPPRFPLLLPPLIITLVYALTGTRKEAMIENRNIRISTFLHAIRIPMEIILLYLFIYKMIPQLMTFEGRNFDILAGISALIVGWLYYNGRLSDKVLLIWNYIGLALILFIAVNAILSAEVPFQQFAFDQPNRALTYFPFILLPTVIVPLVIYQHIGDIIILRRRISG